MCHRGAPGSAVYSTVQGAAVAEQGVAAGGEAVVEGFADLLAQQRQDVGGGGVGEVGRGDFEHQLPDRVRAGGEVVDDTAQRGDGRVRRRIGGWWGWRGSDVADGLAGHGAHGRLVEGRQAAMRERGEAACFVISRAATPSERAETSIRARWDRP